MPPQAPKPPAPPSLSTPPALELADASRPERRKGLFEALISDERVLYHGLLEDPERYEEGTSELLQQLVSGQKSKEELSDEELELLDRATLEFASAARPKSHSNRRPAPTPRQEKLSPPEEAELIYQEHGPSIKEMDIPNSPPTRWWEKS